MAATLRSELLFTCCCGPEIGQHTYTIKSRAETLSLFVFSLMKIWKFLCSALAKGSIDPKTAKYKIHMTVYSTWDFYITLQKPWKLQRKKPSKFALTNFLDDWKLKGFPLPGSIQESAAVWFCFFRKTLQNLYEL